MWLNGEILDILAPDMLPFVDIPSSLWIYDLFHCYPLRWGSNQGQHIFMQAKWMQQLNLLIYPDILLQILRYSVNSSVQIRLLKLARRDNRTY